MIRLASEITSVWSLNYNHSTTSTNTRRPVQESPRDRRHGSIPRHQCARTLRRPRQIRQLATSRCRPDHAGNISSKHICLRRAPAATQHPVTRGERAVRRLSHLAADLLLGHLDRLQDHTKSTSTRRQSSTQAPLAVPPHARRTKVRHAVIIFYSQLPLPLHSSRTHITGRARTTGDNGSLQRSHQRHSQPF